MLKVLTGPQKHLLNQIKECCVLHGKFPISDGKLVKTYIDLYKLTTDRQFMNNICLQLTDLMLENNLKPDYLAGKELHGALIAQFMGSWANTNSIIVRKNDRLLSPVTGSAKRNEVVLVDDVISAGVNMERSYGIIEDHGYHVSGIICVVYRGGGAKRIASQLDIPFGYLFEIPEEVV